METKPVITDKKELSALSFPSMDVLEDVQSKRKRTQELLVAMKLGNKFKHKVKLFFKDMHQYRCVETTVWFVSSIHVALKGGVLLPVKRIYKIEF